MAESNAAAIYDLGYQPYTGPRLGRGYAARSLLAYSFRSAFGVGRGDKAKTMPALVVAAVYVPALVQVAIASATGMVNFIQYANYLEFTTVLIALFAAAQAPELVVTDKQQGVLSLYLSRPLVAFDYAMAKVGALTAALLVITMGPQLILFLGKVAIAASPWTSFKSEWTKLLPIVGGTALISLFVASIALLLASFASRRGYATASVIAFFLVLPPVVEMFRSVTSGDVRRYSVLVHPVYLIMGFANWLFDIEAKRHTAVGRAELPGSVYMLTMVIVCFACITVLLRRYGKVEA